VGHSASPERSSSLGKKRTSAWLFYPIFFLVSIPFIANVALQQPWETASSAAHKVLAGGFLILVYSAYRFARRFDFGWFRTALIAVVTVAVLVFGAAFAHYWLYKDYYSFSRGFEGAVLNSAWVRAWKSADPQGFQEFVMRASRQHGIEGDSESFKAHLLGEFGDVFATFIRKSSDDALVDWARSRGRALEVLKVSNPESCYRLGTEGAIRGDELALPVALKLDIDTKTAALIGTAGAEKVVGEERARLASEKIIEGINKRRKKKSDFASLIEDPRGDYAGACEAILDYWEKVLALPLADSANLIRWESHPQ
jgi:hypothetical protein